MFRHTNTMKENPVSFGILLISQDDKDIWQKLSLEGPCLGSFLKSEFFAITLIKQSKTHKPETGL